MTTPFEEDTPKLHTQAPCDPKTKYQNPNPKSKVQNAKSQHPKCGSRTTFKASRPQPAAGGSGRKLTTSTLKFSRPIPVAGAAGRKLATSTLKTSRPLYDLKSTAGSGIPRPQAASLIPQPSNYRDHCRHRRPRSESLLRRGRVCN